jgi:cation-transporting ATPase E
VLLVVVVIVGPYQDALFGVILTINAVIGITQELRSKRALDHLAVLSAPTVRVVRDGVPADLDPTSLVQDDLIELRTGDQIVVDGIVTDADGLEVDESLLTGEAEPVTKSVSDRVLSGSFVTAGAGRFQATKVGASAYAEQLQTQARRFSLEHSQLQKGIDQILRLVTWVMIPAAALLVSGQMLRSNQSVADALRGSVAGVGSMVPEGLVLLTTIAFAIGALRLARRRVLVQDLAALEGLARVDVVCVDKTGTLTEGGMTVAAVERLGAVDPAGPLAALATADPTPNASLAAIGRAFPVLSGWELAGRVPFSSTRKWSAVRVAGHGTWVLGAPDILLEQVVDPTAVSARVEARVVDGQRVVLLAHTDAALFSDVLPSDLAPVALVVLEERLRSDAAATFGYLAAERVVVKVISGDDPRTVGAIAARLGLPGAAQPVDARTLTSNPEALAATMEQASVFGRVTPDQKRAMVAALQRGGHTVAMTGDGVNDVLALKDADLGIAMGSGSAASRAVGRIVLLDNTFSAFPAVVGEGRRVIANIERVSNLFLTKTVYATLLALTVGATGLAFPFYPRHLTIVSALTIGIPGFFLALAPNTARAAPGFLRRVVRFAVPAGTAAAAATFGAYAIARATPDTTIVEARTTATIALFGVALGVLILLARPLNLLRFALLGGLSVGFTAVLALPLGRKFFELRPPPAAGLIVTAAIATVAVALLVVVLRRLESPLASASDPPARRRGPL